MVRVAFALLAAAAFAQQRPAPDIADFAYGPHERNRLDVWRAKSDAPTPLVIYIHGGGFVQGDKRSVNALLLDSLLRSGVSVAAVNYRFSQHAPYPASFEDSARAVQALRAKAKEWNLDPKRFAATGGSAGAMISFWIGFRDDMAQRGSAYPVARQSTRLTALALMGAQTTCDPRTVRDIIGEAAGRHPALPQLFDVAPEDVFTDKAARKYADCSAITHISKGDPPVMLFYNEPHGPLPADAKPGTGIHHPNFGPLLKKKMDELGIECILRHSDEYKDKPAGEHYRDIYRFLVRQLGVKPVL